jgi:hypothetical protein
MSSLLGPERLLFETSATVLQQTGLAKPDRCHVFATIEDSDSGISSMEIEVELRAEETNVTVRHVVSHCRDEDRMSLSRRQLPHNGSNP